MSADRPASAQEEPGRDDALAERRRAAAGFYVFVRDVELYSALAERAATRVGSPAACGALRLRRAGQFIDVPRRAAVHPAPHALLRARRRRARRAGARRGALAVPVRGRLLRRGAHAGLRVRLLRAALPQPRRAPRGGAQPARQAARRGHK